MAGQKICPDCSVEMVEGFVLDMSYGTRLVPRWLKGPPEKSFWKGINAKGKECREVMAYRCPKCGLLRSYAEAEVEPPSVWGT
ncbi:MAG TPA: PF20097 family protein [Pyrinomonadaceae bacterium]|nr:PF20097 family protein [Pyrinomonadaceae bacterium]